jgi:glycosyltransferase involved in cell wall biosynthesis
MTPELSIIIPTHQHVTLLKVLLDSLLKQVADFSRFEVIVVEWPPMAGKQVRELCESPQYDMLKINYQAAPKAGINEARNFGAQAASAAWLAFVDDDEQLTPYWADRVLETIEKDGPNIFGGSIHPNYTGGKPTWFKDNYLIHSLGPDPECIKDDRFLFCGNIVFSREWFDRLNGFVNSSDDPGNYPDASNEFEIQIRARQMGACIIYDPDLYVFETVHPDQLKPEWFFDHAWEDGKARAKAEMVRVTGDKPSVQKLMPLVLLLVYHRLRLIGRRIEQPFRSRVRYPFKQNYLVERIVPVLRDIAFNWYLLRLTLNRKS